MPAWPDTLPASPRVENFRETVPNTSIRTDMEQGPAKVRQRTTAGVRMLSLEYLMSKAQVTTLESFYLTTLQGGSFHFTFTHPRSGSSLICRFVKPPEYTGVNGNYFKVAFDLEILP